MQKRLAYEVLASEKRVRSALRCAAVRLRVCSPALQKAIGIVLRLCLLEGDS